MSIGFHWRRRRRRFVSFWIPPSRYSTVVVIIIIIEGSLVGGVMATTTRGRGRVIGHSHHIMLCGFWVVIVVFSHSLSLFCIYIVCVRRNRSIGSVRNECGAVERSFSDVDPG